MDRKRHWENVYRTTAPDAVSWYQPHAELSLKLIRQAAPDPSARIIDVGGGSSILVDELLAAGYGNVTVLDLSGRALAIARRRLGSAADRVAWIEADVLEADLSGSHYDIWHDRAVFHFLIEAGDRRRYVEQVRRSVRPGGHVIVATFSEEGPARCSGLEVARYSEDELHRTFGAEFKPVECVGEEHVTPSGAIQSFLYCLCRAT